MPTLYTEDGLDYDIAIAGKPFLSGASAEAPIRRQTGQFRKEQTDQGSEVGEQSLTGWWFRSQASFHGGAGQVYLDGGEDSPSESRRTRFFGSRSMDVWTPGEMKPLPPAGLWNSGANIYDGLMMTAGPSHIMYVDSDETAHRQSTSTGTITAVNDTGGVSPAHSMTNDGTNYFIARDNGVWRGPLTSPTTASTQVYTTGALLLQYVKARLMGASGRNLYELDPAASGLALPAPFYTHPSTNFMWNNFTEAPQGIYASGYTENGDRSSVYYIGIDTSGATPKLAAPIQVVELPFGEQIYDLGLYSYLGTFLMLLTSAGLRVCTMNSDGTIQVGPVMLDGEMLRGENQGKLISGGFASKDGYVYLATVGSSTLWPDETCLVRIDLGNELSPGHYAWASDQVTDGWSSSPNAFCFDSAGRALIGTGSGIFKTFTGAYIDSWIITSGIRYGTSEDKVFQDITVTAYGHSSAPDNVVYVQVANNSRDLLTDGGTGQFKPHTQKSVTYTINHDWAHKVGEYVHIYMQFGLTVDTLYPRITSWQTRGLPSPKRLRVEQIPLLNFDFERDKSGQLHGYEGRAWARLTELEALEALGKPVYLQRLGPTFATGSADADIVVIDAIEFVQTDPPGDVGSGFGGIIMVTVRKIDDGV